MRKTFMKAKVKILYIYEALKPIGAKEETRHKIHSFSFKPKIIKTPIYPLALAPNQVNHTSNHNAPSSNTIYTKTPKNGIHYNPKMGILRNTKPKLSIMELEHL